MHDDNPYAAPQTVDSPLPVATAVFDNSPIKPPVPIPIKRLLYLSIGMYLFSMILPYRFQGPDYGWLLFGLGAIVCYLPPGWPWLANITFLAAWIHFAINRGGRYWAITSVILAFSFYPLNRWFGITIRINTRPFFSESDLLSILASPAHLCWVGSLLVQFISLQKLTRWNRRVLYQLGEQTLLNNASASPSP